MSAEEQKLALKKQRESARALATYVPQKLSTMANMTQPILSSKRKSSTAAAEQQKPASAITAQQQKLHNARNPEG